MSNYKGLNFKIDENFEILYTEKDVDKIRNVESLVIRRNKKMFEVYHGFTKIDQFTSFEGAQSFIDSYGV